MTTVSLKLPRVLRLRVVASMVYVPACREVAPIEAPLFTTEPLPLPRSR